MCKFQQIKQAIESGRIAMEAEKMDMAEAFGKGKETHVSGLRIRVALSEMITADLLLYVNLCGGTVYDWDVEDCGIEDRAVVIVAGPVAKTDPLYHAIADVVSNELIQRTIDHGEV